ncbi:hypothetical protein AHF37_07896 [Paragonimus kellicotti]|nr:hypothetical protein AHF37_07896 [Paragonimus kellicotti]
MPVSQENNGGFWNTPKVVYSEQTKTIIRDLMRESNVANSYRQKINSQMSKGETLNTSLNNDSETTNKRINKRTSSKKATRFYRPGRRPRNVILNALDDEPPYRPPPVPKHAGAVEKARLAHLMAYGEESPNEKLLILDDWKMDGSLSCVDVCRALGSSGHTEQKKMIHVQTKTVSPNVSVRWLTLLQARP